VSEEWECPEGIVVRENRLSWRLLQPVRCEPTSISITNREDVGRISDWSEARVKAEKFEEIDFNTLVTDETMR